MLMMALQGADGLGLLNLGNQVAGMPSVRLPEVLALRLQDISFFLLLWFVGAGAVRLLWNALSRDIQWWPRVSYSRAMALTFLLSLGVLLALSMISGARELLTPGAWRKQGASHRLETRFEPADRQANLISLHRALLAAAEKNEGRFPIHDMTSDIPNRLWIADANGARFVYLGGLSTNAAGKILAFEPKVYEPERYVLTAGGAVEAMSSREIQSRLERERRDGKVSP
jgi:hypothetical protein